MTPEARVKTAIRRWIKEHLPRAYTHWPVPVGYGTPSLDLIMCIEGRFIGVEVKRPGGKPTAQQNKTIEAMADAGALVFVADSLDRFIGYMKAAGIHS